MLKRILLLISFLSFSYNLSAQTIQWENTIGGDDIEWNAFIDGYSYSNISGDKN